MALDYFTSAMDSTIERKMFSADDARKLVERAESAQGEAVRAETQQILDKIKLMANDGQRSLRVERFSSTSKYEELVKKRLTSLGFTIKYYRDQSNGYYLISW